MIKSLLYFLWAGLFEIGGGYLIWLWLREGKPFWWGILAELLELSMGLLQLSNQKILAECMRLRWCVYRNSNVLGLEGRRGNSRPLRLNQSIFSFSECFNYHVCAQNLSKFSAVAEDSGKLSDNWQLLCILIIILLYNSK
jgi:hypothetical protein